MTMLQYHKATNIIADIKIWDEQLHIARTGDRKVLGLTQDQMKSAAASCKAKITELKKQLKEL